ncbi:DUF1410 domain-containing protein [Mesomycoplasma ovipneumoniae]|uniref:DUF1410 domain-containing protein n=1 Tax=Mesomycoplasma ovipneumoniae TaxID=29562 RepID=UPI002964862C|nr:DUF1410 domain-containing protein [Mesomycoplasma ovipneumoniae]MDW2907326.1 DUF1410 domain-containing protein [Mesomycoplasma ovipneumoniae]
MAISTNNNLSFISAPEIARIRTFVDANNTSSFDIKFNDQSLMLNGKEVKINFFADDQPTKMLSSSAQVVGNKLFSLAKNLPKEKHFTISSLEIVENATNFDENGQPQTSQIFFAQNFDQKQKKFFTNATSAMVESVVVDRISEDQSRISMILDSVDDFIKDKIATLYFKVAGSSNLIKSQAQAFSINGNKLVLSWDLINLEPGTNYLIDSVGIADSTNEFVNKLFLNFGPNISTNKLTWTTRPAVSSITYTTKSDTAVELNIAFKNILESLKKAKITYKELIPGGTSKTIDAIIENNSIIANLPIDSLSKGQNYLIEKIEVEDYKSSKGDSDILAVSKTITPAQKIFGVHAPLVLTKIENLDEQQTSAKLKVTFSPETIKAIGNDKVKIYYSLAGSSKLLSAFADQTNTGQNTDNSLTFELSDLEIGSKYNINSIVLTKEVELNQDTNKVLTERNILFGDADHKFDSSQSSFFTQSAIIEVGYDNSYEQRVIATFILADAKGVYNGKTATLKYRLKAKNGDVGLATHANFKEGKISAKVNSARILFDITDLYKQGLYEIDKNSLELEGTTPQAVAVQTGARVRRSVTQFADTNTTAVLIPFKEKLLDSPEKSEFQTIPKTANVTKIQLTNRTKNTATFEVEFGKDFPNQANEQTGNAEKLDDFLNKNKLKVRFKKYGGEQQEQIVEAKTEVGSQKTTFELTGLENGQQYVILGFEQVQDTTSPTTPKVDIYLDDLDFYKDQIIATAAVIKKIEFDTEVETQARLRLELKDDGRYTAGKKLIVELEKIDASGGNQVQGQAQGQANNLTLSGTSLNGIYDFTFLNLEKATKYKIKSVKFEKEATPAANSGVATFASRRTKRSLDPVLVNVDSQTAAIQEEEIDLLETDTSLEDKKSFVTTAKTAKIVKIETESIQTTSLNVKLTLDNVDDYLGQKQIELSYRNLSTQTSQTQQVEATVNATDKTITFNLSNLSPGDKYEIENIKLKEDSTQVRNELDLKKQEFKFEFDNSPNTQAGFEKQFFSPRPNLAQIKPISTSETSVQINVKLNDNGANWNNKFLQIKIKSKTNQVPQPKIPTVYSAEIINGNAVFDISGLEKAGQYEIEELKVLDSLPSQVQPDQIQGGEKVDGFDGAATAAGQPAQPDKKVTKEFVLDAESATITDISYKSDNTSANVTVSFAQNEQFLYQSSANTKRKLQFTFQDAQSGQQVTTQKEFENNNQGTKPTIDLSLNSVSPGNLYVLTKVEDITPEVEGGPKRLKTFKFSDPQPAQGAQNQATTTPEVLSKLYFATKPEVIAYSIDKISETKYLASFTIKDPLAGREITNGGFEGRDVEATLQKVVDAKGEDLQQQTVYNVTKKGKIKNSKFSFEFEDLEKNAIYKLFSLTWADIDKTQQTISGVQATRIDVDPTTKTNPGSNQQFSDFAIKVSDPGTDSKIEGNVAGNGQVEFGGQFTIRPESAKIVSIDIEDKKVDSATITLTFDKTDEYLKHVDYKDKLELVYYQTGSTVEKIAKLTLDTNDPNSVKFKAELTDLEKGTGFRVLGIKQKDSGGSTRRRRSTTSAKPLNFVFDTSLTEETKKFATLPIVNSILQFRNDANPENYDFILNLKDTGDVFKHIQAGHKSIKAKIQFKKVVDGNEAKDTIQEVLATLQSTSGAGSQAKKSNDQAIQDSTTFKFTLTGLDPFAQYYITKIAYDTNGNTDNALANKTESNGDQNSGLFNFSPQAEEKRAFLTYPAKVDVKSIEIQPDFNQNNAKLTIKFDPKFKAFLETHQKIKVNYKSPKGLGQSVEIDKNSFNSTLNTTGSEPTVEVTINNINEPGKYVVESLDFLNEDLKASPLLSGLEVPPIAIKESVTIAKRSFYTNTKIIAIRKKAISETSATIELVIEDPNGSFIGKAVKGTFTYNTDRTMEEEGTIIADEIEKTSKVVFQLKNLDKNTDYSITSLVFDQAQNQNQAALGGAQSQFQNQQTIEFDDQKIQENAQQESGQQATPGQEKQFKTTFESATALGITYQLDNKRNGKPWQKAKVRVFFASQDKPLEEKSTRLKLVYKSSKQGISNTTTTSVQANLVPTQGNTNQGWLNNQPDRAHYYYEFDLDNLDAGAQYTIIGLEDEAQQIKIIVPDPNAPVAVNFSSQPSLQSSFSFNTAPLITKMTYVPSETSIKLNLAVENSQKLDFSNHRAIIKFKKLRRKNIAYGWWDPASNPNDPSTNKNIDSITVRVPQRQPDPAIQAQQDSEENFGITFLEFELGGLEKGNWYLIEEISLAARGQATTPLSLYIDKEKLQPLDKRVETSESEKWQTIVNTTVETTAIRSVTSSTTPRSNITVNRQRKNAPELTSGYFQIELDNGDWTFLKDKYNIQLELESVERRVFYTESKQIEESSAPQTGPRLGNKRQIVLEARGLIPGDKYTIKNYIFNLKQGVQNQFAVRLPQKLKVTPPANTQIDLKTKNAIKAIKYEAKSEGTTEVDVEFYNNNGELNNKQLELKAKIDEQFGNKYIPTTWGTDQKEVKNTARLGRGQSNLKFTINQGLKKAKQYIIESIKTKDNSKAIVFDTPISQESALQRKFYSIAEKTKLINTTISDVTTDSATIKLEFDKDDAFLKDDLVTLYLEKGDQSQSIGATTTITNSGSGGDKLEATFKFLNILEPGRKYKINALTSKTVDLKVDDNSKVQNPNLTQGWKFVTSGSGSSSSSSSSSTGSTTNSQVILDFITQPLITNIVKTQINDNDATIELEGWTKDIQDAGFSPKFTVTEKNPAQPAQPPQQPQQQSQSEKTGVQQGPTPPTDNKITFKVSSLEQFTEYNNITLKLQKNGGGSGAAGGGTTQQNPLSQDLTVAFAPEIASGAKKDLREFRTTAKKLNLADSNTLELKPISTTTVNLSVKLKNEKQANSIADVPFIVKYKKVFPPIGNDLSIDSHSNPVLIDTKTQILTFNISNLEPGSIYQVTEIVPYDEKITENHKIQDLNNNDELLKYLKKVDGLPVKEHSRSGSGTKTDKIYFAPLNVPVSMESAWSHPLRYDYYEGEQVYVRFNEEAGTAITLDWLKDNLKVKLIPNRTHSGQQSPNLNPVEKALTTSGGYSPKSKGQFNNDVVLSDLKWDPQRVTATFKLQPKSLKSIVGAQIKITMNDKNKYHLDPSEDSGANTSSTSFTSSSPTTPEEQSIIFRLQSSAVIVTPTNVDYMNPGLMGFSYAIYDPLDLIQKTGKDYNPFGDFPHLTPYDEQDWLKVVINKQPSSASSTRSLNTPDNNIFNNPRWPSSPETIDIPEPPVAIRTKTDAGHGIKYLTLYWKINSNTGVFQLPEKFRKAKALWYPAGKVVNLPISLQFKSQDITSPSSTYSFVLNSPYGTPGHVMPYASIPTPHEAASIIREGSNYYNRWTQVWGGVWDSDQLIPRINKFPKHISKVFWSAPSLEWTTNDNVLNDIFFLNRALPRLTNGTSNLLIQTGRGGSGGTWYNGYTWNILYVKNKEGKQTNPSLSKTQLNWDWHNQNSVASGFENKNARSSWIISITAPNGRPLLYDPLNYYAMLGPFKPPELPE